MRFKAAKRDALDRIGGSVDAVGTLEDAKRQYETKSRELVEARVELSGLEGGLRKISQDSVDVAKADARFAEAAAALNRVRLLETTLDKTMEFMRRAADSAHRLLAPQVAARVSDLIGRVTDGRYSDVLVDPSSLNVTLIAATGERQAAKLASRGTTEQVYLALRVALAEVLSTGRERRPLLLDDSTVHADSDRKAAILECLHEVSKERQVILFSQEQQVRDWARSRLDDGIHLIELGSAQPA